MSNSAASSYLPATTQAESLNRLLDDAAVRQEFIDNKAWLRTDLRDSTIQAVLADKLWASSNQQVQQYPLANLSPQSQMH